jgi:hypothetical protein
LTFTATPPTEAGILAFANRYGLLGVVFDALWLGGSPDERFSTWVDQIRAMHDCTETWKALRKPKRRLQDPGAFIEAVNTHLHASYWSSTFGLGRRERGSEETVPTGLRAPAAPVLQFLAMPKKGMVTVETRPANLLHALWLQFAFAIVEAPEFRQCPSCGSWFAVSPARRRADATYCKETCRVQAYKGRRKEARRLHAEGKPLKLIAKELRTSVTIAEGWIAEVGSRRRRRRTGRPGAES